MTTQPKKTPRPRDTYRQDGAQKIAPRGRWRARPEVFKVDGSYRPPVRLNRSRHWTRAKSYVHAREMSPSVEVVR